MVIEIVNQMFGAIGFDLTTAPTNMQELIPWFLQVTIAMAVLWFFLSWIRSLSIAFCGGKVL